MFDAIFWPLLILALSIEIGFRMYAAYDLLKPDRSPQFMRKSFWLFLIAFVLFGWVLYLLTGREEKNS